MFQFLFALLLILAKGFCIGYKGSYNKALNRRGLNVDFFPTPVTQSAPHTNALKPDKQIPDPGNTAQFFGSIVYSMIL
jgi:hypothetical protein